MYCTHCGAHIEDEANFCTACGHKLVEDEMSKEKSWFTSDVLTESSNVEAVNTADSNHASKNQSESIKEKRIAEDESLEGSQNGWQSPTILVETTDAIKPEREISESAGLVETPSPASQITVPTIETAATNPNPKKKTVIIAVFIAICLAMAGIIGFCVYNQQQKELAAQIKYEREHEKYQVQISLTMGELDPSLSSPIPVKIAGADFEGKEVSESFLYSPSSPTPIELMRGSYAITIPSSPIYEDGTMFDVTSASARFNVVDPEEGEGNEDDSQAQNTQDNAGGEFLVNSHDDEGTEPNAVPVINLVALDPISITDDQINAAYDALIDYGLDASTAERLKNAAVTKRQQAEEAKVAAERAAKRSEFEARFNSIKSTFENDIRYGGTAWDMALASKDEYDAFDSLMSEIVTYLESVLTVEDSAALHSEQQAWTERRKVAEDATYEDFRMPDGTINGSGNSMALNANSVGIEWTEERINELLARF